MIQSLANSIRLIRRRDDIHVPRLILVSELQPLDVIEIPDRPVYRVDPKTRRSREELQRFEVGEGLSLKPVRC